jgi:hypothetical protein
MRAFHLLADDEDAEPGLIDLSTGTDVQVGKIQSLVGGLFEVIQLPFGDLWINEEAWTAVRKTDTGKEVPLLNAAATLMVRIYFPDTLVAPIGILGGAVLTGSSDLTGRTTALTAEGEATVQTVLASR